MPVGKEVGLYINTVSTLTGAPSDSRMHQYILARVCTCVCASMCLIDLG